MRGAAELTVDRERLNRAFSGIENRSIHRLDARFKLPRIEIISSINRQALGSIARKSAFQPQRSGVNPFQLEIGWDRRAHDDGHSGYGRRRSEERRVRKK